MSKFSMNDITQHGFKVSIIALFSLCGLLYAQQNNIIASQSQQIVKNYEHIEKELCLKVDNKVLMEMIKRIDNKQISYNEQWKEQKDLNKMVLENLKELNISIILLNERLK